MSRLPTAQRCQVSWTPVNSHGIIVIALICLGDNIGGVNSCAKSVVPVVSPAPIPEPYGFRSKIYFRRSGRVSCRIEKHAVWLSPPAYRAVPIKTYIDILVRGTALSLVWINTAVELNRVLNEFW